MNCSIYFPHVPMRELNSRSSLPRGFVLIAMLIPCLSILPVARAVDPPPDGGYANENTAEGQDALFSLTDGTSNTAVGFDALYSNTIGSYNVAIGFRALTSNTTGLTNTATGYSALFSNTTGVANAATGNSALFSNTTGGANTATGDNALYNNTIGNYNTATGQSSLINNTTGENNTGNGYTALSSNETGDNNTANGVGALSGNTSGNNNTASGVNSLLANFGSNNTATGVASLFNNGGNYNTATGYNSLYGNDTGHRNTADGQNALKNNTTGSNNIAVGSNAGVNLTTGDNNIDIGALGIASEANTIRIGKQGTQKSTFIAGIAGVPVNGTQVVVNASTGKLGVASSSIRFKEAIKPMDKASEAILRLKPVIFRYKEEIDLDGIPQFGLIAEEVEKVNPDLVGRDENGKINTVRYDAVNAMLLNEFLKEHRKVQAQEEKAHEQEATIVELKVITSQQQKQIKALTAGLQKITAQVEVRKPASRTAIRN